MQRVLLVVFLAPSLVISLCPSRPTARLQLYRKLRRISLKGEQPLIEVMLEIALASNNTDEKEFDIMKNESSISVDWLPFEHDVVVRVRNPPTLKNIDFIRTDRGVSIVPTLLFEEINMRLRSTYEFKIRSIYSRECKSLIELRPPLAMNVTFACEKIENASCTNSTILDHHPICNVVRQFGPKIRVVDEVREAKVNFTLEQNKTSIAHAKYFIVYYGKCETNEKAAGKGSSCVLALKTAKRRRICLSERDCAFDSHMNFTIRPLDEHQAIYGAQVCAVFDKKLEVPPLVGNNVRIAAGFRLNVPALSKLSTLQTPLVRTIVGYVLLITIVLMFLLTILIYKCVTGRLRFKVLNNIDVWEIEESMLTILDDQLLGAGKFGSVFLGQIALEFHTPAQGPVILDDQRRVAVKIPGNDKVSRKSLFDEIEGMKLVGIHPRICSLIGIVHVEDSLSWLLVMEYCANGCLKEYLHRRRKYMEEVQSRGVDLNDSIANLTDVDLDMVLSTQDLNRIYGQICAGMAYLSSQAIVHGSLCCRHILVTLDHSIKITDFSMSQKESSGIRFPTHEQMLRWTSLEVLKGETMTRKSDVWSFGVVLWEVATIGGIPYHNVPATGVQTLLEKGIRLQKPDTCSPELYKLMQETWHHFANQRPSFGQLAVRLNTLLQAEDPFNPKYIEVPTTSEYYKEDLEDLAERVRNENGSDPERKRSRQASLLLSESERLLGFRD